MTNTDNQTLPIATFPCNKFYGLQYPYREDSEWGTTAKWNDRLAASNRMISASYGWSANRALKIYQEAYEENLHRKIEALGKADHGVVMRDAADIRRDFPEWFQDSYISDAAILSAYDHYLN